MRRVLRPETMMKESDEDYDDERYHDEYEEHEGFNVGASLSAKRLSKYDLDRIFLDYESENWIA